MNQLAKAEVDGPARARELAARADPTVRTQRIGAIVEMFKADLWRPGVTAWELAELWRMKGESIENDASIAKLVIAVSTDKSEVIPRVWSTMFALADSGERALAKAEAVFDHYATFDPNGDAKPVKPEQLMFLTTAIKNMTDVVERAVDRLAKYAEMVPRTSAVNVLLDSGGGYRPEINRMLEILAEELADHPELATRIARRFRELEAEMGGRVVVQTTGDQE